MKSYRLRKRDRTTRDYVAMKRLTGVDDVNSKYFRVESRDPNPLPVIFSFTVDGTSFAWEREASHRTSDVNVPVPSLSL